MSVIWGIPYLFIRIAVSDLSPVMLVFARTAIGALIVLPIALARGEVRGLGKYWLPLLAFASVEVGIPWLMISNAEQKISSSLAGLLVAAVPLVSVVIATSLGNREHLGLASLSGLLLGIAGVGSDRRIRPEGFRLACLAEVGVVVVGYAVGPVILSPVPQRPAGRGRYLGGAHPHARSSTRPWLRSNGRIPCRASRCSARWPCWRSSVRRSPSCCSSP